ncbi:hypothetical protein EJB05_44418, partial [Eragrostis curvula]
MMRGRLLAAAREVAHEDASSPRRTRTTLPCSARADAFSSERSTVAAFCDASGSEEKVTRLSSFPRMLGSALNGQLLCRDPQLITAWIILGRSVGGLVATV